MNHICIFYAPLVALILACSLADGTADGPKCPGAGAGACSATDATSLLQQAATVAGGTWRIAAKDDAGKVEDREKGGEDQQGRPPARLQKKAHRLQHSQKTTTAAATAAGVKPTLPPPPPPLPHLSSFARWGTVALYAVGWVLMMWPLFMPMGRPGTALVFAVFGCIFRAVCCAGISAADIGSSPSSYLPTILLLFGLMIVCEYMKDSGFWGFVEACMDHSSPKQFLIRLCIISATTSAVLLNDTICFVMPPLVIRICARRGARSALPYLIAISSSANIGSSLTIVGNPQNSLIATLCPGIKFLNFTGQMLLPVAMGMLMNMAWLVFYFRSDLVFESACIEDVAETMCASNAASSPPANGGQAATPKGGKAEHGQDKGMTRQDTPFVPSVRADDTTATWVYIAALALIVLAMLTGWVAGLAPWQIVLVAVALSMFARAAWRIQTRSCLQRGDPTQTETEFAFSAVDFALLVLFIGQFVMVGLLMSTGLPPRAFHDMLGPSVIQGVPTDVPSLLWFATFIVLVCNIISNVPAILMLQPVLMSMPFVSTNPYLTNAQKELLPTATGIWILVSWIATVSGNLTMLGSAANQIVAHVAQKRGDQTYNSTSLAKCCFVPTIVILFLGTLVLASEADGQLLPTTLALALCPACLAFLWWVAPPACDIPAVPPSAPSSAPNVGEG